ncbi:hypothetical protein BD309DRAFT_958212 [Dichomitus squalens]|nr:hypothetical protein BD309DRAFT_958212 [Dichomitus squalens]
MPKWMRNNFVSVNGQPVKNAPLIRYLSALLDQRAREGQKVHLQYVKGHAGEEGNEGADYLANLGATMGELPERDWDALIEGLSAVSEDLLTEPQLSIAVAPAQAELEAYAACLADDDELWAEVSGTR